MTANRSAIELENKAIASATVDERGHVKGTALSSSDQSLYRQKRESGLFSHLRVRLSLGSGYPDYGPFPDRFGARREVYERTLERDGCLHFYSAVNNDGEVFLSPSLEFVPEDL